MTQSTGDQCLEAARTLVALARADDAVAHVAVSESGFTRFSDNAVTQSGARSGRDVACSVAFGTRHGAASGNQVDARALESVVRRAEDVANASEPDPEYLPPVEPPQAYLDVPAYYDVTAAFGPAARAEAAAEVFDVARSAGLVAAGAIANGSAWSAMANSKGLADVSGSSNARLTVTMMGDGFSGWAGWSSCDVSTLNARQVAERARDYALAAKDPIDLEPGRYPVLLLPTAAASIVSAIVSRLDARAADERRSAFAGLEGARIAHESLSIRSDPLCPEAPGARRYGDGMATRPMTVVNRGVLDTLAYSRYWAKRQGREPVYSPANVIVDGADRSLDDLLAEMGQGLLVTRFWYIRDVDPMRLLQTGMTRDAMLLVEDGRIARGVKHFRWNNSPLDLVKNIRAIGRPEPEGGWLIPPIVFDDFYMTSKTRF